LHCRGNGFCPSASPRENRSAIADADDSYRIQNLGEIMLFYLWLALGGALGTLARFGVSSIAAQCFGTDFPWGTLIINVAGSFIMGFFASLTTAETRFAAGPTTRQFVMTGVLGGFTTFSSFSLQTLNLARNGDWLRAGANASGSLVLCLVAVWLGHLTAVAITAPRGA
jgi:CrcB protein